MSTFRRWCAPALAIAAAGSVVLAAPAAGAAAPPCGTGPAYRYVVLVDPSTPQARVDGEIRAACGTRVGYYPEIGVAVASSRDAGFARRIGVLRAYSGRRDAAERPAAPRARAMPDTAAVPDGPAARDLRPQQWDMRAVHAPQANAVDPGRASVTVGVLDSGIDATHPALAAAVDPAASAGCLTGVPDTAAAAWAPTTSDHGTHVAGTIAGRDRARGFTGVAPGVRLASVKVVDDTGHIYPEAAVCGFMWAAARHFRVTNNSYYVDPGLFYCPKQAGDAAAYEAVRRAVTYATRHGVLSVAAAGNDYLDLATPTGDPVRPRPVGPGCAVLPEGIDGVVTVSAVGYAGTKAAYSDWGLGEIEVTGPGGDDDQAPPVGQGTACPVSTVPGGGYGYMCGTSMATPHAAGVAALLAGRFPHDPPTALAARLEGEAEPVPCGAAPACRGPARDNSYYGHGLVDALAAVR